MSLALRPGTPEHDQAVYRAACDYQDGLSLEKAARRNRVNPLTLRYRLMKLGWRIDTTRKYRNKPNARRIPDALLDAYPRVTMRQIADACGVSKTTVRKYLIRRGNYTPLPQGAQRSTVWANSLRNREIVLAAVDLRDRGLTQGQIAIRLGISRSRVGHYLTRYDRRLYLWQREPVPSLWRDA